MAHNKMHAMRQKALRTNKSMAGKKGYDKYGAPTAETKRKINKYLKKTGGKSLLESLPLPAKGPEQGGEGPKRKPQKPIPKKTAPKKSLPQKTATSKKRAVAKLASSIKAKGGEEKYKDARVLSKKDIKAEKLALKKQKGSEAPKKQMSKQDRRRSLRAADLAVRKGISLDEAKELQGQRRANRKQFLKNFAANLAGVEMSKGEFNTKDYENYKKNNAENAESNIVSDQQKSNKIATESNAKDFKSRLFMDSDPNSSIGKYSNFGAEYTNVIVPDLLKNQDT